MSNDPKDAVIDYSKLRKQDTVKYSEQLERYEQVAYEGGYGADWLEEVGESVKVYTMICEANNNQPTFAGLMKYLGQKASSVQKSGNQLMTRFWRTTQNDTLRNN